MRLIANKTNKITKKDYDVKSISHFVIYRRSIDDIFCPRVIISINRYFTIILIVFQNLTILFIY